MFTKQQYQKVADLIAELPLSDVDRFIVCRAFVHMFERDNPRFDRDSFIYAAAGR